MVGVRFWSVRHARALRRLYDACARVSRLLAPLVRLAGRGRAEALLQPVERVSKGLLFDCKMCGDCALSKTGMSCPMNCPKTLRNGPCGGVRPNGHCEVKPEMRCVWVAAWDGASRMKGGEAIKQVNFALDHRLRGTSSWLKLAREDHDAAA